MKHYLTTIPDGRSVITVADNHELAAAVAAVSLELDELPGGSHTIHIAA